MGGSSFGKNEAYTGIGKNVDTEFSNSRSERRMPVKYALTVAYCF